MISNQDYKEKTEMIREHKINEPNFNEQTNMTSEQKHREQTNMLREQKYREHTSRNQRQGLYADPARTNTFMYKGNGSYGNLPKEVKSREHKNYMSFHYGMDKDEEEENRVTKGKSSESRNRSSQSKNIEQQTEKLETMLRLEREKKAVQKKNREEENEKKKRPVMKQKRTNNINWTKGYEYGLLDDLDEDSIF